MTETFSSTSPDFATRLAVLEERTQPKPRTVFDKIKDWSGILTFVIAILYTYPLGVWDRFVVTAKDQRTKELNEVRSTILSVTSADSEAIRAYAGITDPAMQQQLLQSANARKGALLMPGLPLIEKHYEQLTGSELVLLGFYINQLGDQGELASKMLARSADKMITSKNTLAAADVLRIKAQMYSPWGSLGPDIPKVRELMKEALNLLLTNADPLKSLQYAGAIAMDWANVEGISGNWACSELLAKWLISQYQFSNPAYAQQLQSQLSQWAAGRQNYSGPWVPTNQASSCPTTIMPWAVSGWPWIRTAGLDAKASP